MEQETQGTTTSAPAESSPSGGYVQSILGAAGEGLDDASPRGGSPAQQADGAGRDDIPGEQDTESASEPQATLEDLIQQYAKEYGVDPNDKLQRSWLKRMADKELYIQKLKAGQNGASSASTTGPELMTAFEKELAAEPAETDGATTPRPQAAPPAQMTGQQQQPPPEPQGYGDIGDSWKTPEDSLGALNEAWADNNLQQVHEIERARLRRNFDNDIAPLLLAHVQRMVENRLKGFVEKDLGDVVPEVRRTVTDRRIAESREFAIDELRKAGAQDIDSIFDEEEGEPIEWEGQAFPNTPLNRILARHPEIMRIQEYHPDPAKAERKTLISRYKLAYQIHKQGTGGVPAQAARKLVEAGREGRERDAQGRWRQSINAGTGASGRGDKPKSGSYIGELNNLPGEVPFASMI